MRLPLTNDDIHHAWDNSIAFYDIDTDHDRRAGCRLTRESASVARVA